MKKAERTGTIDLTGDFVKSLVAEIEHLKSALRHEALRNHDFSPTACSACEYVQQILEPKQ